MSKPEEDGTFLTQGNEPGVPFEEDDLEDTRVSESTRLHKKMREMKQMDDKLAAMKEDYASRLRIVKQGEARFLEKQRNTIEYLRKFKAFILDTDAKRSRAEKKESEEKRQIEQKIKEIESLKKTLHEKKLQRDRTLQTYDQIVQNKEYLDKVLPVSQQFSVIDELLTRYKILAETNTDLREGADAVSEKMEEFQNKIQTLYKNKQNEILVKNSAVASQLKLLEDTANQTGAKEAEVATAELKTQDQNRQFGEWQMAIRNMHARTLACYPTTRALKKKQKPPTTKAPKHRPPKERSSPRNRDKDEDEEEKEKDKRNEELLDNLRQLLEEVKEKLLDMQDVVKEVVGTYCGV
mmetsp:Transcript_32331/g.63220  ORF Transcript_32331/g.63220 Transcript_32331/m.63220 type:complete len:351 (+) Transcript_32331:31-1083(+)